MGALTLAGIIVSALGAGMTGVGGVFLGLEIHKRTAIKTCEAWKAQAEANLEELKEKEE